MAIELTTDQARYIARMRSGWPDADVRVHQRAWGVIVEVRRIGRTIAIVDFAVRNTRVLARNVLRFARAGRPAPPELAEAISDLGAAVWELAA